MYANRRRLKNTRMKEEESLFSSRQNPFRVRSSVLALESFAYEICQRFRKCNRRRDADSIEILAEEILDFAWRYARNAKAMFVFT